jgi:hypothetical protein
VIHTDRDHRIKVQFHWQRGEQSHSRLNHPNDGHSGAPGTIAPAPGCGSPRRWRRWRAPTGARWRCRASAARC